MVSLSRSRIPDAVRPSVAPLWAQPASSPATTAIANAAVARAPHARRDAIQNAFFCGPLIIISLSMPLFVTADAPATAVATRRRAPSEPPSAMMAAASAMGEAVADAMREAIAAMGEMAVMMPAVIPAMIPAPAIIEVERAVDGRSAIGVVIGWAIARGRRRRGAGGKRQADAGEHRRPGAINCAAHVNSPLVATTATTARSRSASADDDRWRASTRSPPPYFAGTHALWPASAWMMLRSAGRNPGTGRPEGPPAPSGPLP